MEPLKSTSERYTLRDLELTLSSGGMQMVFTNSFAGAPILFEGWSAKTPGGFVGTFIIIVLAAFIMRLLMFLRSHFNAKLWSNSTVFKHGFLANTYEKTGRQAFRWGVEIQRMLLAFIMAILGYGLMLVAMTYVVVLSSLIMLN
jgi:hypothetical protein